MPSLTFTPSCHPGSRKGRCPMLSPLPWPHPFPRACCPSTPLPQDVALASDYLLPAVHHQGFMEGTEANNLRRNLLLVWHPCNELTKVPFS